MDVGPIEFPRELVGIRLLAQEGLCIGQNAQDFAGFEHFQERGNALVAFGMIDEASEDIPRRADIDDS